MEDTYSFNSFVPGYFVYTDTLKLQLSGPYWKIMLKERVLSLLRKNVAEQCMNVPDLS